MDNRYFRPPTQKIDTPDTLKPMSKDEHREILNRPHVKDAVKKTIDREKQLRQSTRRKWWRDNWIALLAMIFALIAAIPVIIQGIATILELLV